MSSDRDRLALALGLGPTWRLRRVAPSPSGRPEPTTAEAGDEELDWPALQSRVSECQRCGLCQSRRQTVFGVGAKTARLLIVGEAPGQEEDLRGEPFVGQAGKLLDNMLAAIGLDRERQVYIANVLKCRPPGNRNPEPAEVASCTPYLRRQVQLLQPQLILVMGRFAAQTLVGSDASIASLRGKEHHYALPERQVPMVVTYHPAYLLRNLPDKAKAWTDLLLVARLLGESQPGNQAA